MSDKTIFIYGLVASVLCLAFLVLTLVQFWRIGKNPGRDLANRED